MTTNEKRNYLYLYDLPKDKVSSVKLAEVFKGEGIDVGEKKPQINRDLFKPFYNAIVHIEDPRMYELAKEKMKYLTIDGCQARALPFDKDLRGDNKAKVMSHNIFYKLAKDADKSQLTYKALHEKFEKYGKIKSTKISLNADYSSRGFAFVCFEDAESTKKCLDDLKSTGEVFQFSPKDSRDVAGKIVNNLYFKNIPAEMTEDQVKGLFQPFGDIKSLVLFKNNMGQYGFVCYEDKNGKDPKHGSVAVEKAVSALTDKDMGNGLKMYLRNFLNKEDREREKFIETIRYKNSKKRCNLYVKNFPATWTEVELTNLFKTYGEIEKVRLEKGFQNNTFAFVCFKKPDACSVAKQALSGQTYDGKGLIINHYEIKEIRDLQLEEIRDKRDWEKYKAVNGGFQWNHLTSQPNLTHIIQQLLQLIQQQQQTDQGKKFPQGERRPYQGQRPDKRNFQQNRQQMPHGMNQQQQPGMRMPQAQNQMMPQQPAMPQQPGMPQQQQMMAPQQQNMTPQQKYLAGAMQLLPSVVERNPYMKEQVGHLIFEYVQMIAGPKTTPKITGMLIELPVP